MKERGATVLLVAHRMSLMPIVDELMIIQDGMIAAFGPRDEILEKVAPSRPVTPAPSTRRVA
jgi:ATP-binding cassette subfamily C protein